MILIASKVKDPSSAKFFHIHLEAIVRALRRRHFF
jgi:hypothetical protein